MEKELIELGFSSSEAKIYLELLKNKSLLAGDISKRIDINRRTVYDSLDKLIKKGLIGFNVSSNKKNYFCINPEAILKNIENMKESASKIIPKLKEISKVNEQESKVILYQGRKGIRNILNLILECKEYVSFGSISQFPDIMEHNYEFFQNMKKKLKIKTKTLLSKSLRNKEILKTVSPLTQVRFLSDKVTGPTSTFIFKDSVAIMIWEFPYFGILIESEKVYNSYLEYFNELWKIAKP